MRENRTISRRNALRTIGVGAAGSTLGSGVVGATSNRNREDRILQASLEVMQNTRQAQEKKLMIQKQNGSLNEDQLLNELEITRFSRVGRNLKLNSEVLIKRAATERAMKKRLEFLNNHGREVQYNSAHGISRYQRDSGSEDVSTNYIDESQISCWMVSGWSGHNGADVWVDSNYAISGGGGGDPKDAVTMAWPSGDFDLVEDGSYEHNMGWGNLRSSSFNSATWNYGDGAACGLWCNLEFTVGTHLERLAHPGKVETTYHHGWGDCGNLSISVSYENVSVTPTCGSASVEQSLRQVHEF